jgi:hypothetical protein
MLAGELEFQHLLHRAVADRRQCDGVGPIAIALEVRAVEDDDGFGRSL